MIAWLIAFAWVAGAQTPDDGEAGATEDDGPSLGGVPFERRARVRPPTESFDGTFSQAPVFHWRMELPGDPLNSATHAEFSRPVIVGDDVLVGSAKGRALYRLSRVDGTVLGVYPASAAVQGEALVADGRVYFSDTDGVTYAYTLEGEPLWSYRGASPILVRPTLHAGSIFVTNVDDLAVALDANTGELVWRHQAPLDPTRAAELRLYAAPPAIPLDDVVVLGFSDGSLVGVDAATGEERWAKQIGEGRYPDIVAAPVPFGSDLFTSGYFEPFVAVDLESQAVRWRVDVGSAFGVTVDATKEPTVLYHPGTDGTLRAYSALTGAERWAWDSGDSAALTGAGLVVGSTADGLYLIDPENGALLWEFHEPYMLVGMSASPVVEGRQLLFVTNAGYLYSMLAPEERRLPARDWWRPDP